MSLKNRIRGVFQRKKVALYHLDTPPLTAEKIKKAAKSPGTLERDLHEKKRSWHTERRQGKIWQELIDEESGGPPSLHTGRTTRKI